MSHYQVCVYAISKNEAAFTDRWMDSVREADSVIVTDTGSEDGTVEKLRAAGATVYEEMVAPWRFDTARNLALSHVPETADICVSNDLDEVFEPGWRKRLEAAWDPSCTRARYWFTWSFKPDGSPEKQFHMEKIHRRHGFRWVRPVHEILEYTGPDKDKVVWVDGLVLHHRPDLSKPRSQYLPLLELAARENPGDDRALFWLGREYLYDGQYAQGIDTLKKQLALPTARWDEERSAAMRLIAAAYEAAGQRQDAKAWYYRAIAECPGVREPWLALARQGYAESNWPMAYAMALTGLAITQRTDSYLVEPENWNHIPYGLAAVSALHLGLHAEAAALADKACEMNPADGQCDQEGIHGSL